MSDEEHEAVSTKSKNDDSNQCYVDEDEPSEQD